jgi:predicted exporter
MFDRLFSVLFQFVLKRKGMVLGVVIALTVAAAVGLAFIAYEGNLDLMLPPDPEVSRSIDFLRDSSLSDKIIISLALTDAGKDKKDLFLAADQLAASLTPPFFTKVVAGFSMTDAMDEFSILQYAPQVLGEEDLASLDKQLNPAAVSDKLRGIYRQSLRPESIFLSSLSRTDPLGIKMLVLDKLRALPASMGYDVVIEDGHFVSRDGRHAMLIVQTPVPMMDGQRSKELVAALEGRLKELPGFLRADIISGHLHTVSNERVIKRDITVATLVASVGFLLLFFFVFRDGRSVFVILFPLLAVVWSMIIAAAIQGKLSYLVIGFGTAIVGISDYGLIVYIAMKRGTDISQMGKLAKLVFIDAITTIFSFVVLYFSQIRGYHQLALFSILCLGICLLFSLFILPLVLSGKRFQLAADPTVGDRLKNFRWPVKLTLGIWSLATVILLYASFSVRLDSDVKKLDGSGPEVLQAERTFHEVWGGKANQAILVVTGKSLEEAMETNDRVFRDAVKVVGREEFTSLALFWPSERQRKENRDRWDQFWKQGREQSLKELINGASGAYGFSDRAFSPFFEGLYDHGGDAARPDGIIEQLQERFVAQKNGEFRIMSFFPDEQRHLDSLAALTKQYPGAFIVSGKALSSSISDFTTKEMYILAPLAVLFNVVLAWLFFRNWKETLIALVPLFTGVVWLLGILSIFDMPLNVVSIVAGIISSGVIVDYGLGITYEYRRNLHFGTVMAMTLSALSNVIGAGALLFAQHPALFSIGVAMVISMTAGYLSSVIVVPSLCRAMAAPQPGGDASAGRVGAEMLSSPETRLE